MYYSYICFSREFDGPDDAALFQKIKSECGLTDEEARAYSSKRVYDSKYDYILRDVPPEFASVISSSAYDRGHPYGEAEVELVMENLVNEFLPAIKAYTERIKNEK